MATSGSGEFEAALGRLEEIVQKLERENVGLDESVTLFKEGKGLALRCEALLKNAQSAIETAAKGEPVAPVAAAASAGSGAPATLFPHDA
jgi:exodeoxyribonuclease VII small subunit